MVSQVKTSMFRKHAERIAAEVIDERLQLCKPTSYRGIVGARAIEEAKDDLIEMVKSEFDKLVPHRSYVEMLMKLCIWMQDNFSQLTDTRPVLPADLATTTTRVTVALAQLIVTVKPDQGITAAEILHYFLIIRDEDLEAMPPELLVSLGELLASSVRQFVEIIFDLHGFGLSVKN